MPLQSMTEARYQTDSSLNCSYWWMLTYQLANSLQTSQVFHHSSKFISLPQGQMITGANTRQHGWKEVVASQSSSPNRNQDDWDFLITILKGRCRQKHCKAQYAKLEWDQSSTCMVAFSWYSPNHYCYMDWLCSDR